MSECFMYGIQHAALFLIASVVAWKEGILIYNPVTIHRAKVESVLLNDTFRPSVWARGFVLGELSIYIASSLYMKFETRRDYADLVLRYIHHFVTIGLILAGYSSYNTSMVIAVAQLHDFSDFYLELSKIINYMGYTTASKFTFLLFAIAFIYPRIWLFPRYILFPIINGKMEEFIEQISPGIDHLAVYSRWERRAVGCVWILFVLDVMWAYQILRMMTGMLGKRRFRDIREQ